MACKIRARMSRDENFVRVFFNIGNLKGWYNIDISEYQSGNYSTPDLKRMGLIFDSISFVGQEIVRKATTKKHL